MKMADYLELDSTYRNRILWPKPGEFEILLSNSGTSTTNKNTGTTLSNQSTVQDPISLSIPIIAWTGLYFNESGLGMDFIRGTFVLSGLGNGNANNLFIIESLAPQTFQQTYNYYVNAVFRNLDKLDQVARIIEYVYLGNNNAQVTLSSSTFKFDIGDSFFIGDPTDLSDPNNGFLFVPTGSKNKQDYLNMIIFNESLKEFRPIAGYDGEGGVLAIGGDPLFLWQGFHNFSIRQQSPNFILTAGLTSNTSTVVITGPAVNGDNYKSWFIRVSSTIYGNSIPPPQTETRHITQYDTATNTATVFPSFSSSVAGLQVELSQYGSENANGLRWGFRGIQQVPLYHVKLLRLQLPNKILKIGNGGLPAFQSRFYVELNSVDPTSSSNFLIFSNSPYATGCMFRCTVQQVPNPETQEYITLTGDDMIQTVRFRLDMNMFLRVTLASTGEVFETVLQDTVPPAKPKTNLQLNALFEFVPA